MPIEVTARHIEATQQMQKYARQKADSLLEAFPRVEHIRVILDAEKRMQKAEVVVQGKNRIRAEAAETAERMVAAIDNAMEKIETQLRRHRDKVQDHKGAMKQVEQNRERGLPR